MVDMNTLREALMAGDGKTVVAMTKQALQEGVTPDELLNTHMIPALDETGRKVEVLHVIGGGARNEQLCQWTADTTCRRVVAGPVEATAIGNVLVQAIAAGLVPDLNAARQIVERSFELTIYEPKDSGRWNEPCGVFEKLQGSNLIGAQ